MESPKNLELALTAPHSEVTPDTFKEWMDAILDFEIPSWRLMETIAQTVAAASKNSTVPTSTELQRIADRRAALGAYPLAALQAYHAKLSADRDQKEEAKRFYNQADARASFEDWLSMDFWTIAEAVPLLLERDPRVVSKETIAQDLAKPKGFLAGAAKPPTRFTQLFQTLQIKAERSEAMTSGEKLSPRLVAAWGRSVLGDALPPALATLASLPPTLSEGQTTEPKEEIEHAAPTLVRKAALVGMAAMWPTVENDLHHSMRNGLRDAAKGEGHNWWKKEAAIDWAMRNGKIMPKHQTAIRQGLPAGFFGLPE